MILKKFMAAAAVCALIGNFLPSLAVDNLQPMMIASAYSIGETNDFTYVNMGADISISEGKSPSGVLNIPSEIEGLPVTSVMMQAFNGKTGITAVNLPETLTSINFMAFANCSGLTSVTLPKSLKYLEDGAFLNCFGITSMTIYSRDCQITGETAIPNEATIYGYSGSTAETYARTYGRNFVALPEDDVPTTTSTSTTTTTTTTTSTTTTTTTTTTRRRLTIHVKEEGQNGSLEGATLKLTGVKADGTPITFEENQIQPGSGVILEKNSGDSLIWVSGRYWVTLYLENGVYTLHEESAPIGFVKAEDMTFNIDTSDGSVPVAGMTMNHKRENATTISTTTSTTTTTTEPPVTTTTTIVDPPRTGKVGDTSGDGEISPLDASTALSAYAAIATGGTYEMCGITDENFYIYDVDNNGEISPMDSSLILSYYAYLATDGKIDDMTVWYQQYKS